MQNRHNEFQSQKKSVPAVNNSLAAYVGVDNETADEEVSARGV